MPSPVVMAAALARRTENCKLAILGNAFALREHPLTLAEEHAMIDCISGGRLITGFVRGIGAEFWSLAANPTVSHERHVEAHDLIVRAWTETGPFAFEGKHFHFEYVNVWPRPYQQPHPPIWCPSLGSTETIEWAAHPDRRYVYLQNYSPFESVSRFLNFYRETCRVHVRVHRVVGAARLDRPGLCRRHRRAGRRGSEGAHGGAVQPLPRASFLRSCSRPGISA